MTGRLVGKYRKDIVIDPVLIQEPFALQDPVKSILVTAVQAILVMNRRIAVQRQAHKETVFFQKNEPCIVKP